MKEKPIIFSGPMVRAILEGRKTQTRRIIKSTRDINVTDTDVYRAFQASLESHCPYGQPGDHLWVRETWYNPAYEQGESGLSCDCYYKATDDVIVPWRSSIHMPRWASRITLKITDIRIQRLQEISPYDVRCEGFIEEEGDGIGFLFKFADYWDSLNEKRGVSFGTNPWVWVIEFWKIESRFAKYK